jgi:hypothetical protein
VAKPTPDPKPDRPDSAVGFVGVSCCVLDYIGCVVSLSACVLLKHLDKSSCCFLGCRIRVVTYLVSCVVL